MNLADAPGLPLPQFVQIEPVGQCNLACRMCPVVLRGEGARGKPPAFLDFGAFRALLEQFPAVRELHLQGLGEPLLHPRFFDMVAYAAAKGIEVSTNTNLTALSPRRAELLVGSGLQTLYVSLDAAGKAAYEYIRVGARFEKVLRNLRLVLEARRKKGGAPPGVVLVAVAMRRNLEELPALVRLAHDEGADGLNVQHLCHDFTESTMPERYRPMRRFVDSESLAAESPERVRFFFSEALRLAAERGLSLRLPNEKKLVQEPKPGRCDWPWRGAYVSYSGEAMPCCMVATPDRVNFGNMAKDGVEPVWNGDAYRRFRERLASDDPPEICRGCALYRGAF